MCVSFKVSVLLLYSYRSSSYCDSNSWDTLLNAGGRKGRIAAQTPQMIVKENDDDDSAEIEILTENIKHQNQSERLKGLIGLYNNF